MPLREFFEIALPLAMVILIIASIWFGIDTSTTVGAARGAVALGFFNDIVEREVTFFELTFYMFPVGWLIAGAGVALYLLIRL